MDFKVDIHLHYFLMLKYHAITLIAIVYISHSIVLLSKLYILWNKTFL